MKIPARYEGAQQLGQGGGGAVYAVTDRITGARLAFKVLAEGAGEAESRALVREAVALSALDGLGLPRIIGFGALASGERYMVRELAPGDALDAVLATPERAWLAPLADATDQLTLLHRSGLLHGDVKPANIVVSAEGRATLVDLGLAAPLREGGPARGLTPKYAAPEVLAGEAVGVRAEVYALGATLQEGLDERGDELERDVYAALTRVAKRATEGEPEDRYPSADELGTALRRAAGLGQGALTGALGWQVLGLEALGASLEKRVVSMQEGGALALEGPLGSGRSTLLRRLAFSLGLQGVPAAVVEAPQTGLSALEALRLATAGAAPGRLVLCVDDLAALPADALAALRALTAEGARLVAVATEEELRAVAKGPSARFEMPELERRGDPAEQIASLEDALDRQLPDDFGQLVVYEGEAVDKAETAVARAQQAMTFFKRSLLVVYVVAGGAAVGSVFLARRRTRALGYLSLGVVAATSPAADAGFGVAGVAAAAALACGTKYPGGILLAPVLALALNAAGRSWGARLGEALRAALVFAAVFVVTTPGSLLQASVFVSQVRRSMGWYATGHMGHTVTPGLPHLAAIADYASFALFSPWPAAAGLWTALALGGLAVTLRRDPTRGLLLTAAPLAYAVYFAQQRVMIVRNLLLLAPFLAVGAALGAAALGRFVARRPVRGVLAGAAASLLLAQAVDLGARAESIRRRGDRAAFERALRAFVRSQQAKPLGASPRAAALLPGLPTSGPRAAAAELWVTYAREPPPAEWPANRRGLVVAVFGPEEVNYDFYPTWEGDDRLLVLCGPRARSEGLAPGGSPPSAAPSHLEVAR
mgnify:CR=1 FL=1